MTLPRFFSTFYIDQLGTEKPLTPPRKERLRINKIAKFESDRS